MDSTISQLTVSAVVVWIIERLKGASWFPALTPESSERVKQVIGAIAAALTAVGITYQYNPTLGVLTISGHTISSVGSFTWAWIQNFVSQQILYHGIVKHPEVKP